MANQFSRGITFLDGTSGHVAAELHALIDSAHILPAAITDQPAANPTTGDRYIFVQASTNTLKSVTHTNLIANFPHDGPAAVFSLRRLGVGANQACSGADVRLRNPITGLRWGQAAAVDRVAVPQDVTFDAKQLTTTIIDFTKAEIFYDSLTADKTYTWTGGHTGRRIIVQIKLNGHVPTMPTSFLVGTVPVLGSGTAYKTYYYAQTAQGITGYCIAS